MTKRINENTKA